MKKKTVVVVILVVLGLAVGGLIAYQATREDTVKVTVDTIQRKDLVQTVTATGKVEPIVQVEISAYVSAEIVRLAVEEGEQVKKGALLVVLDSKRYRANRDQLAAAKTAAESQVQLARANLEQAKREYKRVDELHLKGLVSDQELEAAGTAVDVQEATLKASADQVDQAQASLRSAGDDLDKTILRSPIAGTVIAMNKEVGEIAMGSQLTRDVIMTVADMSAMELVVDVDEADVPDVKLHQAAEVEVDAFPNEKFKGVVTAISKSPKVEGVGTQTEATEFEVTVTLTDDIEKLLPGMSATAKITTDTREQVLAVPIQCLTMRDPNADPKKSVEQTLVKDLKDVVFKVKDGRARMAQVTTGISSDFEMEIEGTLGEGEQVVCGPYQVLNKELRDGDLLEIDESAASVDREET
ncbi:MAG: efflux RND transporter periplasmic adaptor subunit [Deltaproteobacteria bacterium]|nr:efflux RND transporter periplasmic adaptor subunit [Deltaproteobacteria bacterium]MCB9489231.1 efflux RND transporter periplasmic adaptor subunit [Deltaproteobacteria bacterium]